MPNDADEATHLHVRLAAPEDISGIMDLLMAFDAECGFLPLNRAKVLRDIVGQIARLDLFVAEQDQALVGLLGIEDNVPRHSDHHVLGDSYFFVDQAHRGGDVGRLLMRAATLEAERRELPLFIRVTNYDRVKRRGRVSDVEGFFPTGFAIRLR